MIQRIQSVYLLLVVILLIASMSLPVGFFIGQDGIAYKFSPFGVEFGGESYGTWGLFVILLISTLIAAVSIFLYKNRILQMRLNIFNMILLIGYYIVFIVFLLMLKSDLQVTFRVNLALCLPLICMILTYLAIRAIGRDEVMVKSADRIR